MKHVTGILLILLFISGCVTLPNPVDEEYLRDQTPEETAKLNKIEAKIIERNKERDKVSKDLDIIVQRQETSKGEITSLEAKNEYFLEQEKLYALTEENEKIANIQKGKLENKKELEQARVYSKYLEVNNKTTNALLEVKESELAVKVAELNYEKALIAKKYQEKRAEEFEDKMIDDVEYKKFWDDQKVRLKENKKKYDKTAKELQKTEEELKKSGYEVEK